MINYFTCYLLIISYKCWTIIEQSWELYTVGHAEQSLGDRCEEIIYPPPKGKKRYKVIIFSPRELKYNSSKLKDKMQFSLKRGDLIL